MTFHTVAVGRRFHAAPAAKIGAGQRATLRHEAANARDPNALLVVREALSQRDFSEAALAEPDQAVLGYLPAAVAAHLAPLLLRGCLQASVTVLEAPRTPKASLPIRVEVWPAPCFCTH